MRRTVLYRGPPPKDGGDEASQIAVPFPRALVDPTPETDGEEVEVDYDLSRKLLKAHRIAYPLLMKASIENGRS